ncbi:metal-sensing transcriptional repressor [Erwiniaceae bacterium L1_54_6]|nr:metal-sensing transcriptional repressor [Erwiniaceae bacterium L1_54_6]
MGEVKLTQSELHNIQVRLNKIKGQLASIESSLGNPLIISGTLQQLAAVNGGVKSLMREFLEIEVRSEVCRLQQEDEMQNADAIIHAMRSFLK